MAASKIPIRTVVAYSLPDFGYRIASYPLIAVIPAFYAKHTAVGLGAIGTILLTTRLLDAVTDPIIGHLSDRTRTSIGRRKPWMIAGAVTAIIGIFFLYRPPAEAGAVYLTAWMVVMYIAWTMFDVPYKAWGAELTSDYHDRSRITNVRSMFATAGGLLFLLTPFLPFFDTTEMSPGVLHLAAWLVAVLLPLVVITAVVGVPQGGFAAGSTDGFRAFLVSLTRNRPAQIYAAMTLLGFIGLGANSTVMLIFMDSYLGIGDKFSHVLIASTVMNIVTLPMWLALSRRMDKAKCWMLGYLGPLALYGLILLVPKGPSGFLPYLVIMTVVGAFEAIIWFLPTSVLADVVDYDTLRNGQERAGKFFAIYLLMAKVGLAFGGGIGFWLLEIFGFRLEGPNSAGSEIGMLVAYLGFPAVCYALGVVLLMRFPIDARRHAIIRKRIERRSVHQER